MQYATQYVITGLVATVAILITLKILEEASMYMRDVFIKRLSVDYDIPIEYIEITGTKLEKNLSLHLNINRKWVKLFGETKFANNKQLYAQFNKTGLKRIHLIKKEYQHES